MIGDKIRGRVFGIRDAFETDKCPYCFGKLKFILKPDGLEGKAEDYLPKCEKCDAWIDGEYNDYLEAMFALCKCEKCDGEGTIVIRDYMIEDPNHEGEFIPKQDIEECKKCRGIGFYP